MATIKIVTTGQNIMACLFHRAAIINIKTCLNTSQTDGPSSLTVGANWRVQLNNVATAGLPKISNYCENHLCFFNSVDIRKCVMDALFDFPHLLPLRNS